MPNEPVFPEGFPRPLAPYSPGIKAHNAVYTSGIVAVDANGALVGSGDVAAQTRCVLESIKAVLEAAGGSLADIVHNAIFLKDMADYRVMNEVYAEFFPSNPPARYCIRADLVRAEFLVEISSIAHINSRG